MLLSSYTYEVSLPECVPSAVRVNAIAELSEDIREVLPYLNARVRAGIYNHEGGTPVSYTHLTLPTSDLV